MKQQTFTDIEYMNRKVVYRGIAKNMNRFNILFASANLVKCIRGGRVEEFCRG